MNAPSRGCDREKVMAEAARALVKPRVIVVMDDPLAKVLEVVLQHGRYESRVATEPAKVLELLRDPVPHIVLMDLDAYPGLLRQGQDGAPAGLSPLVFTRRRGKAPKVP